MKEKEALKKVIKNMEKAMKAVKETAKKEREKKEKKEWQEAEKEASEDIKHGRMSPIFTSAKEGIEYLSKKMEVYQNERVIH